MSNNQKLTGRSDMAIAFLKAMFPKDPWHLVAIPLKGKLEACTFAFDEAAAAVWIEARQGRANLYFHVNRLRDSVSNVKAKKQDVKEVLFLHTDVDDVNALPKLEGFEPRPTAIIFSGGGYQAFWRLIKSEANLNRVERCNVALANALGGDNCHNVDRIMRLPGTLNVPNAKKRAAGRGIVLAKLISSASDLERTYDLSSFQEAQIAHLPANTAGLKLAKVNLETLPACVPAFTKTLIVQGDDPDHPIGSENARYPSRSEAVFRVACDLVKAECSLETIISILLDDEFKISTSIREKRRPKEYAIRQVEKATVAVSNGWPDVTKDGRPRATFPNAMTALQRMGLNFSYNEFHRQKIISGYAMQEFVGDLSDDGCTALRVKIIEEFGFDAGKENVRDAANALCLENIHHPVRDYLNSLKWDGKQRLSTWMRDYLGATDSELNRAIGRIVLIAAVRRVRSPGVKFDTILVLEGPQGSGKSSALEILAGRDNFSDQDILQLDTKGQMEAMEGVWIQEIAELNGISRADTSKVKAFASRRFDKARGAYARFAERRPRECILIGTTNDDTYLRDRTGNRRFWPVLTNEINLKALAADRDQLWAEAAYWEEKEESIILPEDLWPAARQEQEARLEEDPWYEILAGVQGREVHGELRVTTQELLAKLEIPAERQPQHLLKRIAANMRQLGWEKKKIKLPGGQVAQGYVRPKQ